MQLGPEVQVRFRPVSAFAEYFELPGAPDQLRITLASYPADCEKFTPPPPAAMVVTVLAEVPLGRSLGAGDYPWTGALVLKEDGTSGSVDAPRSIPFVRLHNDARPLSAGGQLRLTTLERSEHGVVKGELDYRTSDAKNPSALTGHFEVHLCRTVLDASRASDP